MSNENISRLLTEVGNRALGNTELVTEIEKENSKVRLNKQELKAKFIPTVKERLFAEYMAKDAQAWPTLAQVNDQLNASKLRKENIKDELEKEKDGITEILEQTNAEYGILQDKVKQLKEKLALFESKKAKFESLFNIQPVEAKHSIDKCQKVIEKIETEITKQQANLEALNASITDLKQQIHANKTLKVSSLGMQAAKRAQKVASFLENVTGVREHPASQDQIQLELLGDSEGISCYLTLTLRVDCHGDLVLIDAKTDSPHLVIKDLLDVAVATNDIPYLVRNIQARWLQRCPMLSELDSLCEKHFVDWIEEQGLLRVLVGKNGKLFTLKVPRDYPASKDITLVDLYRLEELQESELPGKSSSLTDWVVHLETKFADQDV